MVIFVMAAALVILGICYDRACDDKEYLQQYVDREVQGNFNLLCSGLFLDSQERRDSEYNELYAASKICTELLSVTSNGQIPEVQQIVRMIALMAPPNPQYSTDLIRGNKELVDKIGIFALNLTSSQCEELAQDLWADLSEMYK